MENFAIIKTTIGTLKLKPNHESEVADETLMGRLVNIIEEEKEGWYLVETDYRYKGYIHESQMLIDNTKAKQWDQDANHTISWGIVDVMKEPKYQSYPIQQLTRGAIIKSLDEIENQWIKIELPTGDIGWIREDHMTDRIRERQDISEDELRKNIVDIALSYLGAQYRWGGKTPLGIDCSGLSAISYLMNGIVIYRDAKIVETFNVREITMDEIKPGDLLYWPGHVAIYIGDDRYVHSTGPLSGVVINSLNPEHEDYREKLADVKQIGTIF